MCYAPYEMAGMASCITHHLLIHIDNKKKMFIYFHFCDFCGRFNKPKSEIATTTTKNREHRYFMMCLRILKKPHVVLWAMKIDL